MPNRITLICTAIALGAVAQAQQGAAPAAPQPQTLLSRLRSQSSTRQQLEQKPVEVAQPAPNQPGYQPGITFPQAAQQAPQPVAPPPGYPPPVQNAPYNMQPGAAPQQGQRPAQARPTQTPARSRSNSSEDDSDDNKPATRSGTANRSSSKSSSNAKSEETPAPRKSSASSSAKSSPDTEKSSSEDAPKKDSAANSSNSSALEKIVKKVESGSKSDEQQTEKAAEVKRTKEEIEAAKARDAALKEADKATTVVASFLKLANDGFYTKANDHLAPAIKKYFESEISAVNGTEKSVLDELTGNGNITMVTYVNTTVRGEGAVVEAELGYQDGRMTRRSFDLIQLNGDWKIVLPVTEASVASSKSAAPAAQPVSAPSAPAPAASAVPTAEQAAASAPPMVTAPPVADPATTQPQ